MPDFRYSRITSHTFVVVVAASFRCERLENVQMPDKFRVRTLVDAAFCFLRDSKHFSIRNSSIIRLPKWKIANFQERIQFATFVRSNLRAAVVSTERREFAILRDVRPLVGVGNALESAATDAMGVEVEVEEAG